MSENIEKLRAARIKRVEDTINLKVPDRVPFFPQTNLLAIQYGGITARQAFYDYEKWFTACLKMNTELEPDLCWPPLTVTPGRAYEILDCTQIRWPGHDAPDNASIQFIDDAYMKEDEFDRFIDDPTDFIISCYLPRIFSKLKPFDKLQSLKYLFLQGYKGAFTISVLSDPEIADAFRSLARAADESSKYFSFLAEYEKKIDKYGLVNAFGGSNLTCAFDILGDNFRGITGIMTDMYRRPDKLIAALDKIQSILLDKARTLSKTSREGRVFIPLHLGADGFMSLAQFERFYWPYLKKLINTLLDEGMTPCPFFEGDYTSRLEYLTDLPKAKIMGIFDKTDLFKAKKVIGKTMCIVGNMPITLLQTGTVDDITDYSKKLIDEVGKDGGFIMSSRSVLDCADKELINIWADFTKEYGQYD